MSSSAPREPDFRSWFTDHKDATWKDCRTVFLPGVPESSLRRWWGRRHIEIGPVPTTLRPHDREAVIEIVSETYAVLREGVRRIKAAGTVDRDEAQGMASLQRMAAGLVETHPELTELVRVDEPDADAAKDEAADLAEIMRALGVAPAADGAALVPKSTTKRG